MQKYTIQRIAALSAVALAMTIAGGVCGPAGAAPYAPAPLRQKMKTLPMKIAWECYVNGNWEIFVMNADGSRAVNLTKTPGKHEHYPQISPDGRKIAYTVDTGEG